MSYLVSHPIYLSFKYCHEKPSAQTHALTVVDAITEQSCDCGIHSTSAFYQHISKINWFKFFISIYFVHLEFFVDLNYCFVHLNYCFVDLNYCFVDSNYFLFIWTISISIWTIFMTQRFKGRWYPYHLQKFKRPIVKRSIVQRAVVQTG